MTEDPDIETRLKDLLDETRLAMLGTQLLLGLQHRAAVRVQRLAPSPAALNGLALLLILAAAVLLLAVPAGKHSCLWPAPSASGRMATGRKSLKPLEDCGIDH
jgi:hypothetical protein